jgi:hypothetical protein
MEEIKDCFTIHHNSRKMIVIVKYLSILVLLFEGPDN